VGLARLGPPKVLRKHGENIAKTTGKTMGETGYMMGISW